MSTSLSSALQQQLKNLNLIIDLNTAPNKKLFFFIEGIREYDDVETFIYQFLLFGNDINTQFLDSVRKKLNPFEAHFLNRAIQRLIRKGKIVCRPYDVATLAKAYENLTRAPKWAANYEFVIEDFDVGTRHRGFVANSKRLNTHVYN
jgi:hypothetical protein